MTDNYVVKLEEIRKFWNEFVYDDIKIAKSSPGTKDYFQELRSIRAGRLEYLPRIAKFDQYKGKRVLDVGCRIGLDSMRFAEAGALVTGIDLAESVIKTARQNFAVNKLEGDFFVMDGENIEFEDNSFDLVFAHGVVQYTANPQQMINEMHRVLKPGGVAILMAYNRYSWLVALSTLTGKNLTHEEAPGFKLYSRKQFADMFDAFSKVDISPERFPEKTGLHKGVFSKIYYLFVVGAFNALPKSWVKPVGAHLLATAIK